MRKKKNKKLENENLECDCCNEHTHNCNEEDCCCEHECTCGNDCNCTSEHNCGCGHNCECDCDLSEDECCCEDECCDCCECESHNGSEYLELAQRIQAEFDNYRKRNVDAVKEAEKKGMMKAVEKLLPVIDSIKSAKLQVEDEQFKKSIETLYNQVIQLLGGLNVKKIEAEGLEFNPHKHYAVLSEEAEGVAPDMVLEELQEGFEMDGKVIRYSVVKVSK